MLFSTSIAENIAYARPGRRRRRRSSRPRQAANAHDFIARLPDGYETPVGERGMRLSGGERQRIALARAFLKDAPILILDEPTSSVDVEDRGAIMEAMERLMAGPHHLHDRPPPDHPRGLRHPAGDVGRAPRWPTRSDAPAYRCSTMPDSVASARSLREGLSNTRRRWHGPVRPAGPSPRRIRAFKDRKGKALGNAAIYWLGGVGHPTGAGRSRS